jgi:ketosteroid isomerase-like protein
MEHGELLRATYQAFNARDSEAVLSHLTSDVDWPNGWEGGRLHGREAVRDYWRRQWATLDATVEPIAFVTRRDGRVAVEVRQVAHGPDGTVLADGPVLHVYTFRGDLIAQMDIEQSADVA